MAYRRNLHLAGIWTSSLFIAVIIMLLYGVKSQSITCDPIGSATTNVFPSYRLTVFDVVNYTLSYDPVTLGPGERIPVGTNEVTVTAVNSLSLAVIGNCTFNVTVSLQELPIVCPTGYTTGTDEGQATYIYQPFNITYLTDSMTYQSYGHINRSTSFDRGTENPTLVVGANDVRANIFDSMLSKMCTFQVTVEDKEPPTVICPDDIYLNTSNVILVKPLNSSDNVGVVATVLSPVSINQPYPAGRTEETITVSDAAGNRASCTINVTVDFTPNVPTSRVTTNKGITTEAPSSTMESGTSAGGMTSRSNVATTDTASTGRVTTDTLETMTPSADSTSSSSERPMTTRTGPDESTDDIGSRTTMTKTTAGPDESTDDIGSRTTMTKTTAGPATEPNRLPLIIGVSVAGAVLLVILVAICVICASPSRRSMFGIGPKEAARHRDVGASRHGVATDTIRLDGKEKRRGVSIYDYPNPSANEMLENPTYDAYDDISNPL